MDCEDLIIINHFFVFLTRELHLVILPASIVQIHFFSLPITSPQQFTHRLYVTEIHSHPVNSFKHPYFILTSSVQKVLIQVQNDFFFRISVNCERISRFFEFHIILYTMSCMIHSMCMRVNKSH